MTARSLILARNEVKQCRRCTNHADQPLAMEVNSGGGAAIQAEVAFIVPAPTNGDLRIGKVKERGFMYFRAVLNQILSPEAYTIVPVAGCRGREAMCRSHLEAQLYSLENCHGVVLVGKEALDAWRPDQTLAYSSGRVYQMLDRWWCVPLDHPEAVTQGWVGKQEYRDKLMLVGDLVLDDWPEPKSEGYATMCPVRRCGFKATWWDNDEVGYCEKHRKSHGGTWKKWRKQWDSWKMMGTQERLEI